LHCDPAGAHGASSDVANGGQANCGAPQDERVQLVVAVVEGAQGAAFSPAPGSRFVPPAQTSRAGRHHGSGQAKAIHAPIAALRPLAPALPWALKIFFGSDD